MEKHPHSWKVINPTYFRHNSTMQNELSRIMPSGFSPLTTYENKMTSFKKFLTFRWLAFLKKWNTLGFSDYVMIDSSLGVLLPTLKPWVNCAASSWLVRLKSHTMKLLCEWTGTYFLRFTRLIYWSQQYVCTLAGKQVSFYLKIKFFLILPTKMCSS